MPVYRDDKRNTYYVSIRKKDSVTGKTKHITKRGFETRKAAKAWEAEQLISEESATETSFAEMNKLYVAYKNARDDTQHQEIMRMQKYFADYCNEPISKIQKKDLLQWQLWLDSQAISTVVKNYMVSAVRGTYRFASTFYGIPDISMVLKRFKKKQEDHKEMQTWTPKEFSQFISVEENPYYHGYFTFLYWTGVRRSEGLALRKKDFDGNKVKIYHSIKYFEKGFQPLKNESSKRSIIMDDVLYQYMQPLLDRCSDDDFVFGGTQSLPIRTVQNHFESNIKKSGVKRIRLHDLRHSFATNAINAGCNIVAVSKYLGHSTIEQTLQTYAHLLNDTEEALVKTMTNLHNP